MEERKIIEESDFALMKQKMVIQKNNTNHKNVNIENKTKYEKS